MYSVSVAFGSMSWVLMFNSEKTANNAMSMLMSGSPAPTSAGIQIPGTRVTVTDDFGQSIQCNCAPTAVLFEDLEKSRMAHVEYRMHQARIQTDFQKRAETDQSLRAARGGPAIMTPFMGGRAS